MLLRYNQRVQGVPLLGIRGILLVYKRLRDKVIDVPKLNKSTVNSFGDCDLEALFHVVSIRQKYSIADILCGLLYLRRRSGYG